MSNLFDIKIKDKIRRRICLPKIEFAEDILKRIKQEAAAFSKELAVLGVINDDRIYFDKIPKQERSYAYVKVLEYDPRRKAVFHLHPPGVTGFSSIDYEYLNQNYIISIVVDTSGLGEVCYRDDENEQFIVDRFVLDFASGARLSDSSVQEEIPEDIVDLRVKLKEDKP